MASVSLMVTVAPLSSKWNVRCRNDLSGVSKLAHAQAMADMVHMSGFVAEEGDDSAIGYWFGSAQSQIDDAPLILFTRNHSFSVVPGAGIAETVLVLVSHGDDRIFVKVRNLFRRFGLQVSPTSLQGVAIRSCSPSPQTIYEQLITTHSADLSTATPHDTGSPVEIMTIERGPGIS
jgi:hypothetical protein